jgi:hypothetical protein
MCFTAVIKERKVDIAATMEEQATLEFLAR